MENQLPEILDCHCGAKAQVNNYDRFGQWRVMCDGRRCHTLTGKYLKKENAINGWNKAIEAYPASQ